MVLEPRLSNPETRVRFFPEAPTESRCSMDDYPLIGDCGDTERLIPKRAADDRGLLRRINEMSVADRLIWDAINAYGDLLPGMLGLRSWSTP